MAAASSTQTPAAQSPLGALAPASQETPSDQTPTNASSPSSLTTIPAGLNIPLIGSGKAGESSAAEASANFMPFVFFLPLLASSVSMLPAF